MAKPKTIIYSDTLFSALCLELNPGGGGVPAGATAKVGGLSLAWIEETIEIGRRVPENGLLIDESEKVWKVRAGSVADVAPVVHAHGDDMASYGTIVFDLDFALNTRAIHRIVELNRGVTGEGDRLTTVTWPNLAAQDHLILLILSRPNDLVGSPQEQKHLRQNMSERRPVENSYDLISPLGFKFVPLDSQSPSVGTVLPPDNYVLDGDLDKPLASALEPWIKHGKAFRVLDPDRAPVAARQMSFCSTGPDGHSHTIAGSFRYEKSHVGFLPATELKPIPWIKTITKIGEALDSARRSPTWLSKMADGSDLEKIALIVRPALKPRKGNPVEVFIEVNGEPFPVKIPRRGVRKASNYNQDHLRLIKFARDRRDLVNIKVAAAEIDWGWPTKKFSAIMNALRDGVGDALKAAGLSKELADKMFPKGWVGMSGRIKRDNIRITDSTPT